ncbi:MAG: DNA cytosine methyltransferase [Magnetococcales bacterium]|nr:DNA cytosine methyltransferase [Magnetococcales bacterium]
MRLGPLRVLDLFSGIGGFSLGLGMAGGFETVAFCESEPFCRGVLARHWPGVPIYHDVRELTAERLTRDGISPVDLVCGGFPCQDISDAGQRKGIEGERSGLWSEFARLVGEIRPSFALVENVPALLRGGGGRWMGRVLGDLAALGYDAEWHLLPASAVGAPHRRERVWIVAYPAVGRRQGEETLRQRESGASGRGGVAPHLDLSGFPASQQPEESATSQCRLEARPAAAEPRRPLRIDLRSSWPPEPDVARMVHGLPGRVDRVKALGNAVVPPLVAAIGRGIIGAWRDF